MTPLFRYPALILLSVSILVPGRVQASERYLDYYFFDAGSGQEFETELKAIHQEISAHAFQPAIDQTDRILESVDPEQTDTVAYAKLKSNAGLLRVAAGRPTEGMLMIADAILFVEERSGSFDKLLIPLLTLQGAIHTEFEEYEAAEDAFRRAQHIAHRHDGVYTREQLPIVEFLTEVNLARRMHYAADREQRFNLKINEQVYGRDSEALLPVLETLGEYFATRGETMPLVIAETSQKLPDDEPYGNQYRATLFRDSIELYERAIKIIEDNYGPNDLRLVGPLQGLARARLKQRASRRQAENAMERMLQIVESNPASDVADHARAMVELADTYTMTSDGRAEELYIEAWQLLENHPDLAPLQNELLGVPKRIYPENRFLLTLDRLPLSVNGDINAPLYADVEFTVIDDGRVANVRIIDGNVPNEELSYLRKRVKASRYRPRIVNGRPVETEGLMLHQTFRYSPPEPSNGFTVNVN